MYCLNFSDCGSIPDRWYKCSLFNQRGKTTMCRMLVTKSAVPARVGQMTTRNTGHGKVGPGSRLSTEERVRKDTHWMVALKNADPERFKVELRKLERLRKKGRLGSTMCQTLSAVLAYLEAKFEAGRLNGKVCSVFNEIMNGRLQRAPRQ